MSLTPAQLDQFRRDGYLIVPDLFSPAEMDAALEAMDQIFYGRPFPQWRDELAAGQQVRSASDGFTTTHNHKEGRSQFPVGAPALDRLIENPRYLDAFEQCLGAPASYCNAHLFLRSGPTDKRHAPNLWEGYHIDHHTNCLLPPSENGLYSYVNCGVYLHDVVDDGAPMLVIPGSHHQAAAVYARAFATGNAGGGSLKDLRLATELAAPVPSTARRGSALFYSSYLIHAAQPFRNKQVQRAFWTLSMCRQDNDRWTRFANPFLYGEREQMMPFFTRTTPRVRALFGWPPVGHPYYTTQTLGLLAQLYPEMDLEPYRP
ncbi:MAG: phytanoyl-CoA dioxygenase family protein [Candidatus Handelsmanbacteria bacterium]|nr:phytanoyl-CoA dioxygenase family protein [Candidatus Handelsmanbacteria bacterium]